MSNKIKRILVTGSNGSIGTRLMQKLAETSFDSVGLDIKKNNWDEKINLKTTLIDLRDKKNLLKKKIKADLIIHLAANARVYNLIKDPVLARDNVETTFNILEFARKNNIKKIIFASSREVYGQSKKLTNNEYDVKIENSESPYTASKIFGESILYSYSKCYGIEYLIFRFSNIYGMYDTSDRVIPLFLKLLKNKRNLKIYGKNKYLDFTYIDDAVNALVLGISKFNKLKNQTFNISCGEASKIINVAKYLIKRTNSKSRIYIKKNRTGEIMGYIANINKAKKQLKFKPKTNLKSGLDKTILWYKENYL